jgi:hypothetical protein
MATASSEKTKLPEVEQPGEQAPDTDSCGTLGSGRSLLPFENTSPACASSCDGGKSRDDERFASDFAPVRPES